MDDQTRPQPQSDQPPQQPQWGPPPAEPQQPQWSPPPQQQAPGWGPPGYAAPPPRPMAVTVTGIFFVILGVLVTLMGLLVLVLGQAAGALSDFENMPGLGGAVGGVITVFGVIILVFGILWLASGIGVFMAKQWARIIGIIMGVLGVIVFGLGTMGSLSPEGQSNAAGIVIVLLLAILSAVAVWALATAGPYFARR